MLRNLLAFIVAVFVPLTTLADVVPVPDSVVPERIDNAKPRNGVFILSDDHRYDAMGFMGHPFAKTPHMDAMAKNGVHLKNAFVTTSLCSPSRASINPPRGRQQNKRLRDRGGVKATDFPEAMIVDEPLRKELRKKK